MSLQGEGTGRFQVAILKSYADAFKSLPAPIQAAAKSRALNAVAEPTEPDRALAEGQQLASGLTRVDDKFFYFAVRFFYDAAKQIIVIIDVTTPVLSDGPH